MCQNAERLSDIHFFFEHLNRNYPLDIFFQTKHKNITLGRCNLISPEELYSVFTGQLLDFRLRPKYLVFGQADTIQAYTFRFLNHL